MNEDVSGENLSPLDGKAHQTLVGNTSRSPGRHNLPTEYHRLRTSIAFPTRDKRFASKVDGHVDENNPFFYLPLLLCRRSRKSCDP